MRGWLLSACALLCCLSASAQTGTWKNYTSMKYVRGVVRNSNGYWAATSGGLFRWTPSDNSYLTLTSADGLQSIDLTAVSIDRDGAIWSGSSTGILHVYSPDEGSIRLILDIFNANQTNKRINQISMAGDTALISTDFGLSLFRISKFEFGDTFTRFGNIPSSSRVTVYDAERFDGKFWACISDGQTFNVVAVADVNNPNLLPPESWTLLTVGSPGTIPRSLSVFNGRMYCGASTGLYYFENGTWLSVAGLQGTGITTTYAGSSGLLMITSQNDVRQVDTQNAVTNAGPSLGYVGTSLVDDENGKPFVGALGPGLLSLNGSIWQSHVPDGPASSQFTSVAVSPDGVLWCGSGDQAGTGLFRFDGTEWTNITRTTSALPSNDVYRVSVGCNGTAWASTYGAGVVELPPGTDTVTASQVFGRNVGMVGIPNDQNFVVISNVVCDGRGNTLMNIVAAADRNIMVMRKSDGTWIRFPVYLNGNKLLLLQDRPVDRCLAVDAFDHLWAVVRESAYKGLICLGNRGTVDSTVAFYLTTANGLPSNEIRTIVADRDNDVWVGTDRGIGIILEPGNPTQSNAIAAYRPLNGLVINCIAVDPLNQKWVGTTEGAFLLSQDGTQTLASYTTQNTQGKLIANDIRSIAVDPKSGTVYFASLLGLASLTTAAAAPRQAFEELDLYPNPFLMPATTPLTVSGLVENSRLKVLSIDGSLIRDMETPGGLIGYWDGKNQEGNEVPSGVYVVVAYSADGSAVATGKVAVIRR